MSQAVNLYKGDRSFLTSYLWHTFCDGYFGFSLFFLFQSFSQFILSFNTFQHEPFTLIPMVFSKVMFNCIAYCTVKIFDNKGHFN